MPEPAPHEYVIHPGRGVGHFALGERISTAISTIRTSNPSAPLEVHYPESSKDAEACGIIVSLPEEKIELRFDQASQRLVAVSLNDPENTRMIHNGVVISSETLLPTFATIYRILGPTFPGKLQPQGTYCLSYPGVTFVFQIPKKFADLYSSGEELPLEFPDGTTPVASSIQVHLSTPVEMSSSQELVAMLTDGTIRLEEACLQLGASPQEVEQVLGVPCAVCHKPNSAEYLYNYFNLGIDLVFNQHHTLIKFVLHSNLPGHRDFNIYDKCRFSILLDGGKEVISSESSFGAVEAIMGESLGRQPVLNSALSSTSPFGATKFYGWQPPNSSGLILEVTNSGQIASASIFQPCNTQ